MITNKRRFIPFDVALGIALLAPLVMLPSLGCASYTVERYPGIPRMDGRTASRAVSWENQTGAVGAGGKERSGRKGAPCIPVIKAGETATLMDVAGAGAIRHIWITLPDRSPKAMRSLILRMYWDGNPTPSVEVPLGDFFGVAHGRAIPLTSALTTMTLGRGLNSYFVMPFRTHARVTVTNDQPAGNDMHVFFYQIDFERFDSLPVDTGYFHATFRRENPTTQLRDFVICEADGGPGLFLGCVIGVRALEPEWWGEGEMKFYLDGDAEHPTICGTGTEDYFGGAWGMDAYQTPYHGCPLYLKNESGAHELVSMYRWHVVDPVYFKTDLRATMQQMGWKKPDGLFERSDDWSAAAFWYQRTPSKSMPQLPDRAARVAGLTESAAK